MLVRKSGAPYRDVFADRMLAVGCALMLVPCLLAVVGGLAFSWPLLTSALLPRGLQPVPPARYGETLLLVTTFTGPDTSENPTTAIDRAILDAIPGDPFVNARVARLVSAPETTEEARRIGEQYDASVLIWGTYSSLGYTVQVEILKPVDLFEPRSFAFEMDHGSQSQLDDLADFTVALLAFHGANFTYSSTYTNPLVQTADSTELNAAAVAFYRAEAARWAADPDRALAIIEEALDSGHASASLYALQAAIVGESIYTSHNYQEQVQAYEQALDAVESALTLEPDCAAAYYARALAHQAQGDLESALSDLTHALDLMPGEVLLLQERAALHQTLDKFQGALADYTTLITLEPGNADLFMQRGRLYISHGYLDLAIQDFEQAYRTASEEQYPAILDECALLYLTYGEYELALDQYNELGQFGYSSDYLVGRGIVYWEMGDEEAARREWSSFISASPYNQAAAYNNLAWQLAIRGTYELALEYVEVSLNLDSTDANTIHTRGYIYLGLGEYDLALEDFISAQTHGLYGYDTIYRDMADAYLGLGLYGLAIDYYIRYLELMPNAYDRTAVAQRLAEARAARDAQQ